jgi:hypothetical protein
MQTLLISSYWTSPAVAVRFVEETSLEKGMVSWTSPTACLTDILALTVMCTRPPPFVQLTCGFTDSGISRPDVTLHRTRHTTTRNNTTHDTTRDNDSATSAIARHWSGRFQ